MEIMMSGEWVGESEAFGATEECGLHVSGPT